MQAVQYLGPNQEFSLNSAAPKPSPVSERPSILAHFSCNQEDVAARKVNGNNRVVFPLQGPGQVLVEVRAAALCHTELHFCDGTLNLGVSPITMVSFHLFVSPTFIPPPSATRGDMPCMVLDQVWLKNLTR